MNQARADETPPPPPGSARPSRRRRARVARPWQRKKKIRTTMTCVAFFSEMIFCVSARIVAAVLACSDPKPLCTSTESGTPGKSVLSSLSLKNFRSVRSDSLAHARRQRCPPAPPPEMPACGTETSSSHSQRSGVGALVRDHDRVLVRPVPNKD